MLSDPLVEAAARDADIIRAVGAAQDIEISNQDTRLMPLCRRQRAITASNRRAPQ
jgi:hypothetical protein